MAMCTRHTVPDTGCDLESIVSELDAKVSHLGERLACLERLMLVAPLEHFNKIDQAIEVLLKQRESDPDQRSVLVEVASTSPACSSVPPPLALTKPTAAPWKSSSAVLEQDFAKLEEALEAGIWESDGDDLDIYICEDVDDGPAGAVVVGNGDLYNRVELVHWLCGGEGARIADVALRLILHEVDQQTGDFALRVSHCEDLEEGAFLAVAFRPASPPPHNDVDGQDEDATSCCPSLPLRLLLNGEEVVEDVGPLPLLAELNVALRWSGSRSAHLQYRLSSLSSSLDAADGHRISRLEGNATAAFYTAGEHFDCAKAVCFSGAGVLKVRLLYIRCETDESDDL